jgi:hypothetical protein
MVLMEGGGTFKMWVLVGDFWLLGACLPRGLWDPALFPLLLPSHVMSSSEKLVFQPRSIALLQVQKSRAN